MKVLDDTMVQIWEAVQQGTVAIHCLAGIHRAAVMCACFFLYRHYKLGHTDVPHDKKEIYKCMKEVRPSVDEAYPHIY